MGRLILLAGPSCVGKSPLAAALARHRPDLLASVRPLVLYNDRDPRPGERDGEDYHFRTREQIEDLRSRDDHAVFEVRGDLQALDLGELQQQLEDGDVMFEGNPTVGSALLDVELPPGVERISAFVSPLSLDELRELQDPDANVDLPELLADVMRRKLLRRTKMQKGILAGPDLAEIERRCTSAYDELKLACRFGCVLPNHDGEDSENWSAFARPLGDARRAMLAVADLLAGQTPAIAETWPENLLP